MIVLLDCEEHTLSSRLNRRCSRLKRIEDEAHIVHQRINFFKQVTLPVVRYFDELGKLVIVSTPFVCLSTLIDRSAVSMKPTHDSHHSNPWRLVNCRHRRSVQKGIFCFPLFKN